MAPRRNIIIPVGDPSSVAQDLPPTIHTYVTPTLDSVATAPKGVRYVGAGLRKLNEWRALFNLHNDVPPLTRPKLLIHSGHGNVSILYSNIPPGRAASSTTARATILRIMGAPCLGRLRLSVGTRCPQCGLSTNLEESLESHVVKCPNGGMRRVMHSGLVGVLVSILKDVRVRDMVVVTKAS